MALKASQSSTPSNKEQQSNYNYNNNSSSSNTGKLAGSSSSWLKNWLSQITKSTNNNSNINSNSNNSNNINTATTTTTHISNKDKNNINSISPAILPWKKDQTNTKSNQTSVVLTTSTEPISLYNIPSSYNSTCSTLKTNRKNNNTIIPPPQTVLPQTVLPQTVLPSMNNDIHRPSITLSLAPSIVSSNGGTSISTSTSINGAGNSTERRNSQQTICSSSDDQSSAAAASYCQRRDSDNSSSKSSSVLSDLWSKAKKRHPHYPRFHWPHRNAQSLGSSPKLIAKKLRTSIDYYDNNTTCLPSSYRQYNMIPKHLKRHSISSSLVTSTTPSCSRPNSILLYSRPDSLRDEDEEADFVDQDLNPTITTTECYCTADCYYFEQQQPQQLLHPHQHINPQQQKFKRKEHSRWVLKHELTKLTIDGLFSIPDMVTQTSGCIEKQILQIGCGDAAWAIEVASQYPKWSVTGLLDQDNIVALRRNLPRNLKIVKSIQQNLLQALRNLEDQQFDLISSRFLLSSYPFEHYQSIMNECVRICKHGAWIEVMEMDMRIYHQHLLPFSVSELLNNEVIKVTESKSLDPRLARKLPELISNSVKQEVNIEVNYTSLPLGVWGGRLGVLFRDDVHNLIESYQADIANLKEIPCRVEEELEDKMEIMDSEMESNHAFMNMHTMIVQKKTC